MESIKTTDNNRDTSILYLLLSGIANDLPLSKILTPNHRNLITWIFHYLVGPRSSERCWIEKSIGSLKYAEYSPSITSTESITILYLHGAGSRSTSFNKMRLDSLPRIIQQSDNNFPFHVITPLCPIRTEWSKPKQLLRLGALLQLLHQQRKTKIIVTGPSMGGLGSYMVAAKYTSLIMGVIPICGGGNQVYAPLIANKIPCWFHHAANDTCIDVQETDALVAAMQDIIPIEKHTNWIKYTRYEKCNAPWNGPDFVGHDSFNPCYTNEQVWQWVRNVVQTSSNIQQETVTEVKKTEQDTKTKTISQTLTRQEEAQQQHIRLLDIPIDVWRRHLTTYLPLHQVGALLFLCKQFQSFGIVQVIFKSYRGPFHPNNIQHGLLLWKQTKHVRKQGIITISHIQLQEGVQQLPTKNTLTTLQTEFLTMVNSEILEIKIPSKITIKGHSNGTTVLIGEVKVTGRKVNIENVSISNPNGVGISLSRADLVLKNVNVYECGRSGVQIISQLNTSSQGTTELTASNCNFFNNNASGISIAGNSQLKLKNCKVHDNKMYGLMIRNGSSVELNGCDLRQEHFSGNKKFLSVRGQNSSNRQRTRVVLHANCSCTIASMREDMNNVNICCQERKRFVEWICKTENGDNAVTIAASKSSMYLPSDPLQNI